MKIITDNLSASSPSAAVLGNFDGVHLGHKYLINKMLDEAVTNSLTSAIFTFLPHPERFYGRFTPMLTTVEQKLKLLEETGVDVCFQATFNSTFAELSAESFIRKYLIEKLNVKSVTVGDDFKFGKEREGNTEMLKAFCAVNGLRCNVIPRVKVGTQTISSSLIRYMVQNGEMHNIAPFLGRDYSCVGTVEHGQKLGKTLGFPTANLKLESELIPPEGVYSAYIYHDKNCYDVMLYIGRRPTITNNGGTRFELNILDFPDKQIYGERLEVFIKKYIRQEKKFDNLEQLKEQLKRDRELITGGRDK